MPGMGGGKKQRKKIKLKKPQKKELHEAVKAGDEAKVDELLATVKNINEMDLHGMVSSTTQGTARLLKRIC